MIFKKEIDENTKIEIEYDYNEYYPIRSLTVNGEKFDFYGSNSQKERPIKWAFEYLHDFTDIIVRGDEEIIKNLTNEELDKAVQEYQGNIKDYNFEQAVETLERIYEEKLKNKEKKE